MSSKKKIKVLGVNLSDIRNRNETRVAKALENMLSGTESKKPDSLAVQDIYALALNNLPARYTQAFSVVLDPPLADSDIERAVLDAIRTVVENPTGTD